MLLEVSYPKVHAHNMLTEDVIRKIAQETEPEARLYFQQMQELNKEIAKAKEMQAKGKAMQAQGLQGLKKVAQDRQDILTKMFHSIFNGKKSLPIEEISNLFETYLSDGSLTVEETMEGKSYAKINSMRAVTLYLDNNPNVKTCNFMSFKGEVYDIPALAEYLAKSSCRITAIGINKNISAEAKKSLAEAIAARNGGLKVQYSA